MLIPINLAAQYEDMSYHAFWQKVHRNNQYKLTTVPAENGGKERLFVDSNFLSSKARKKNKASLLTEAEQLATTENSTDAMPWYVDYDVSYYIANHKDAYNEMVELAGHIEHILDYKGKKKTDYTEEYAAKLGIGGRTLYTKQKKYLDGAAWAMKMSGRDGMNYNIYKILALCPAPRERHKYPSLSAEVKAYIDNVWYEKTFAQNQSTVEMLYHVLTKKAAKEGWKIPSYSTVARYIQHIMETDGSAHLLAEKGSREWRRWSMYKGHRDNKSLKVMQLVQGDVHKFDCWVKYKHENGKVTAIRPALVAWIDVRSRCIVSYSICFIPDSQQIKLSLVNMIYKKKDPDLPFDGVPEYLLLDNGKEYRAETLTGTRDAVKVGLDSEVNGFYRSLGIKDVLHSLPYRPWSKGQIERFFGTVCRTFTKWLKSYTGTLTGSLTDAKINKNINKMLERDELVSIHEFEEMFRKWLKEVYHVRIHRGLKRQGEKWVKPIDVYRNEERYYQAPPPKEFIAQMLLASDEATVQNRVIDKFKIFYTDAALAAYNGKKVDIRYEPGDMSSIFVYDKDGKFICEAEKSRSLNPVGRGDDEDVVENAKEQNRQYSKDQATVKYRRTPLGKRGGEAKVAIMPMLEDVVQPDVVSLPNDKQYRDAKKGKEKKVKTKAEKLREDYVNEKAMKAIEEIRKLG